MLPLNNFFIMIKCFFSTKSTLFKYDFLPFSAKTLDSFNKFVTPPTAETTTTHGLFFDFIIFNTRSIFLEFETEDPPNFITII